MSSVAGLAARPSSSDVIVVDNSSPQSSRDLLHPSASSSALLTSQHFSHTLTPASLSPPQHDNDVIVLDSSPVQQQSEDTSPIRLDESPRKRRRATETTQSTTANPTSQTSPVIVVDDDDEDDSPVEIARVVRRLHPSSTTAPPAANPHCTSNHQSTAAANPSVSSEADDVIEVSAVGPRASSSTAARGPFVPVMPVEPRLSAPRSRSPVYHRATRQGSTAMSMPHLFNRAVEPPATSTTASGRALPRRRYGVPATSIRPFPSTMQQGSSSMAAPLVPGIEQLGDSLFLSSPPPASLPSQPSAHAGMLNLGEFSPPPAPTLNTGEGLPEFVTLNHQLTGSDAGPSNANIEEPPMSAAAQRRRGFPRTSHLMDGGGPSRSPALLFRSLSGAIGAVSHGSGNTGPASQARGNAHNANSHGTNRHVTFADSVTTFGRSGFNSGELLLNSVRSTLGENAFNRFSNAARHNPSVNGHSTFARHLPGMTASSGSNGTGGGSVPLGVRVGSHRRRYGGGSSSGYGAQSRRRSTPGRSIVHHYYHMMGSGPLQGSLQAQILRGMALGERLDYEQLVQLDDHVNREKNRADKDQIDALPVQTATENDKDIRCCICMCDIEPGEELRVLPCSHKYHKGCIDEWLTYNGCCPVDKKRIAPARSRRRPSSSSRRSVRQRTN